MKKICFLVLFFFSYAVFSSNTKSKIVLDESTKLLTDVQSFLRQFGVARLYQETRKDFLQRLRESKKFETVAYSVCTAVTLQDDKTLTLDKTRKKHLLGLFTPDIYVVKECGFWGGDEDGLYLGTTRVVGKNLARLKEKGTYEWLIELPQGVSGNEFANTPIQPLIDSLMSQPASEIIIPLNGSTSVVFTKGKAQITARFQYKSC